ncbi:hypothetical protein FOA52_002161 [Chlamydomonas sp. UWO 241]|nr:hypothetical protein FOA52_002161 [Chlamydomonas sp. UWO 241]
MSKLCVFVYAADGYVARSVAAEFQARGGYDVLCANTGTDGPEYASASYTIGSPGSASIERQFLGLADVVVVELMGHAAAARTFAIQMSTHPFRGKRQVLIGVSDPLVWVATRPPPLAEDWDRAQSPSGSGSVAPSSPGRRLGTATSHAASAIASHNTSAAAGAGAAVVDGTGSSAAAALDALAAGGGGGGGAAGLSLTASDVGRRVPGAAAAAAFEAESVLLRSSRKGRLRCHVVCPGILYGAGEGDGLLHPMFRAAWEAGDAAAPEILGPGTNALPMLHVTDLARYIACLSAAPEPAPAGERAGGTGLPPYCLVADDGAVTQAELVRAVSTVFGTGAVSHVPSLERLSQLSSRPLASLDLSFVTTPLPEGGPAYTPAFREGFVAQVGAVAEEYRAVRNVRPLRVLLLGPPMAGKSALAARLAHEYGLEHITPQGLLDDSLTNLGSPHAAATPAATLAAAAAELSGKEARVSGQSMAGLLRGRLACVRTRNRGYVLDGFPRSLAMAKHAFTRVVLMTPEEAAEARADAEAAAAMAHATTGKGAKDAGKGGAKGAAAAAAADADAGPEVPPGSRLAAHPEYAPSHVMSLECGEEELRARLAAVEAAEGEAANKAVEVAGASSAPPPPSKGGKASAVPLVPGHNNEKDFARRWEAWGKGRAEEAEDLALRTSVARARWGRRRAAAAAAEEAAAADAASLKARRRRARLEVLSTAASESTGTGTGMATDAEVGPEMPQHGGLLGLLVHELGASYTMLLNPTAEGGPLVRAVPAATGAPPLPPVVLPAALENAARTALGPPRNFDGPAPDPPAPPALADAAAAAAAAAAGTLAGVQCAAAAQCARVKADTMSDGSDVAARAHVGLHGHLSPPLTQWLLSNMLPVVTEGLLSIAHTRPRDPVKALAQRLRAEADRLQASYIDPHTNPSYDAQRAKLSAKAQRDEWRVAAAVAKEEKERARKLATKEDEGRAADAAAVVC